MFSSTLIHENLNKHPRPVELLPAPAGVVFRFLITENNMYYTLLGLYRDDDGCFFFEILFGDYDKDVVTDELTDVKLGTIDDNLYRLTIMETDDDQDAIDAEVDALNEEYRLIHSLGERDIGVKTF